MSPLDSVVPHTPCLTEAFFNCTPAQLKNKITAGNELEDKTTIIFTIDGEGVSHKEWLEHHNAKHPERPITYAGQLMQDALKDEGILSFGEGQSRAYTKNLVSYCFHANDGLTIRVRHEERKRPDGTYEMVTPDISVKVELNKNDTASRGEFESNQDFVREEGSNIPKFHLTFLGIIEGEVQSRMNDPEQGPLAAMAWLRKFIELVGYDFLDKRERSNINCRRTQPYSVMYTRYDANGELIRDPETNRPALFKTETIPAEEKLQGIKPANKIVFMHCLDVNRVFEPGCSDPKIKTDVEMEHEHQDKKCKHTPGGIFSTPGVTREESDAMYDYLTALKERVLAENGMKLSHLSGMNKDARAAVYINAHGTRRVADQLTLRGSTDNFVAPKVNGFEHLCKLLPIVRLAYDQARALAAKGAELKRKVA